MQTFGALCQTGEKWWQKTHFPNFLSPKQCIVSPTSWRPFPWNLSAKRESVSSEILSEQNFNICRLLRSVCINLWQCGKPGACICITYSSLTPAINLIFYVWLHLCAGSLCSITMCCPEWRLLFDYIIHVIIAVCQLWNKHTHSKTFCMSSIQTIKVHCKS